MRPQQHGGRLRLAAIPARGLRIGHLVVVAVGPAVIAALEQTGYDGYLTFEYFHPFLHYPEALIYQTSDALDRILGRKK